jgi:hypothetical protein
MSKTRKNKYPNKIVITVHRKRHETQLMKQLYKLIKEELKNENIKKVQ